MAPKEAVSPPHPPMTLNDHLPNQSAYIHSLHPHLTVFDPEAEGSTCYQNVTYAVSTWRRLHSITTKKTTTGTISFKKL
jgi:hypothetical protein